MIFSGKTGALFTDFYELTMAAGYFKEQMAQETTFSLYVRGGRKHRNYYISAGLQEALDTLEGFGFSKDDIGYLDIVYKMVEFDGRGVRKKSPGKINLAGKKQVFRSTGAKGCYTGDVIGLRDEPQHESRTLLKKVMENGRPVSSGPTLEKIRRRVSEQLHNLEPRYKRLDSPEPYPVELSSGLVRLQEVMA